MSLKQPSHLLFSRNGLMTSLRSVDTNGFRKERRRIDFTDPTSWGGLSASVKRSRSTDRPRSVRSERDHYVPRSTRVDRSKGAFRYRESPAPVPLEPPVPVPQTAPITSGFLLDSPKGSVSSLSLRDSVKSPQKRFCSLNSGDERQASVPFKLPERETSLTRMSSGSGSYIEGGSRNQSPSISARRLFTKNIINNNINNSSVVTVPVQNIIRTPSHRSTPDSRTESVVSPIPPPPPPNPRRFVKRDSPCLYYRKGCCVKGEQCRFLHNDVSEEVKEPDQLSAS